MSVVACVLDEGSLFNHAADGIANVEDTEEEGIGGVVTVRDVYPERSSHKITLKSNWSGLKI